MKKKIKRVVLGVGYPWYFGRGPGMKFGSLALYKAPPSCEHSGISSKGTGNGNKIRLVAEILK